jgi:hypothetical protein
MPRSGYKKLQRRSTGRSRINAAWPCPIGWKPNPRGAQYEHGLAIDRIHGAGTADLLRTLGKARGTKLTAAWLLYEIDEYKKKVKNLKGE